MNVDINFANSPAEKLYNQEISFERVNYYLGKSHIVVLARLRMLCQEKEYLTESLFRQGNIGILIDVLETYSSNSPCVVYPGAVPDQVLLDPRQCPSSEAMTKVQILDCSLQVRAIETCLTKQLLTAGLQTTYEDLESEVPPWFGTKAKKVSRIVLDIIQVFHHY